MILYLCNLFWLFWATCGLKIIQIFKRRLIEINPQQISKKFDLLPITAEILYSRGFREKHQIERFLNPSLDNLFPAKYIPNIQHVKDLIFEHIRWNNKICVIGDYDVDGVTAAAILSKTLDRLDADYESIIGDRFKDGYGLSKRLVDSAKEKGCQLIITVDLGISNNEEIKYAQKQGIDVIVIDHHLSDSPPDCLYVDLKVKQGKYPYNKFSGAGITWRVCQVLLNDKLYDLLDIVAFSTIADVVPLLKDNRAITTEGLKTLENGANIGLQALKEVQGLQDSEMTTGRVGYTLAPCINAQGRLYNNQKSLDLLLTDDKERALKIARDLGKVNRERQQISNKCLQKAKEQINPNNNIIVVQDDIPAGVVGLVAGDIKEEMDKPTIVFGQPNQDGICKGSARSVKPLHLKNDILNNTEEILEGGGGHASAAGMSIKKDKIPQFKKRVNELTKGIEYELVQYDAEILPEEVCFSLIEDLEIFEPTGRSNPRPKFLIEGDITDIKATNSGDHLLFKIGGIKGIGFNMWDENDKLKKSQKIIGVPDVNNYRGRKSLQIKVKRIV